MPQDKQILCYASDNKIHEYIYVVYFCKTYHTFEISNYISDMCNDICKERKVVVNNTRVNKS